MTLLANIFSFSTTFSRMFSRTHKSGYLRATSKKEKASKPLRFQDFQCRVSTEKMPFAHHLLYRSEIFFLISGVITFLYCCAISQNWIFSSSVTSFFLHIIMQIGTRHCPETFVSFTLISHMAQPQAVNSPSSLLQRHSLQNSQGSGAHSNTSFQARSVPYSAWDKEAWKWHLFSL